MSYEYRDARNYYFGTLLNGASVSDTSLSAAVFASLPGGWYSSNTPSVYIPLVLGDPATGNHEIVWVIGHEASSQTVTVLRGREGTTAQAWSAGTQVVSAPTANRDSIPVISWSALPGDAHVGMRAAATDKAYVAEKTYASGWQASCGVALPDQVGKLRGGAAPPSSAAIVMRGGHSTATTNSGGEATHTFLAPFPNSCLAVCVLPSADTWIGQMLLVSETASGFTLRAYRPVDFNTSVPVGAGIALTVSYVALGY
ncbi:hypothetical protein [Amycolatopsis anabasis]|uniref:hypothetical protein n=1 Tax=Amycolatopsis anabasis TaxID=1840409 RepID=UPI00131E45EB|nr:hypothetical protein [Amycolatopsis anabasis]